MMSSKVESSSCPAGLKTNRNTSRMISPSSSFHDVSNIDIVTDREKNDVPASATAPPSAGMATSDEMDILINPSVSNDNDENGHNDNNNGRSAEIEILEDRVKQLEELVSSLVSSNNSVDSPLKPRRESLPAVEYRCFSESYEKGLRQKVRSNSSDRRSNHAEESTGRCLSPDRADPDRAGDEEKDDRHMKIVNSPPAVQYRSFTPSFEEGLRQRVKSNSRGSEAEQVNPNVNTHGTDKPFMNMNNTVEKGRPPLAPSRQDSKNNLNTFSNNNKPTLSSSSSSSMPSTNINNTKKSHMTVLQYIKVEMLGEGQVTARGTLKAAQQTDTTMEEFLRVPPRLETLLLFGLAICIDSFFYFLTFLPLKCAWSSFRLLCTCLSPYKNHNLKFHRRHLYPLLQMSIIAVVFYLLSKISIGTLYHWIRGQHILKLYLLIAMVEIFDRLMCSFGQDALDSLYWNTTSRPRNRRTYVSLFVVIGYATLHSMMIFVHIATLNVAMNSVDNSLLSLLIGGNFAEIKSTVFKKYNKQNLFKITTSDICERFKLALFLMLILLLNLSQGGMTAKMVRQYVNDCALIFAAELVSDWIKHSFITKFNFIKSDVYADYGFILAGDVTGIGHEGVNLDHTHAVVKRLGFSQIPLLCVMLRYIREAVRYANMQIEGDRLFFWFGWRGVWVCLGITLMFVKIGMGLALQRVATGMLESAPPLEEDREKSTNGETTRTRDGGDNSKQFKRQVF